MKNPVLTSISIVLGAICVIIALSFLFAFPVKWLWNTTVTELFNLEPIGFWMAWRIMVLCGFLFKPTNTSSRSD